MQCARSERSNMPLKVSISSVEWCFFTQYGRKVDIIECRKKFNPPSWGTIGQGHTEFKPLGV